jgi:hypothetical protein
LHQERHVYQGAQESESMNRSATPRLNVGIKRQNDVEDIEREFLGLSLDIARLREKVLALAARLKGPASPMRGI